MLFFDIAGKKVQVYAHRSQRRMTKYFLEAENITTVEQIVFGEGMPEYMRGAPHTHDSGLASVSSEHLLNTALRQGYTVLT